MSKKRVVVSLGHEALGYTVSEQWDAVKDTAKALADLVEADYQLTITHSNGPQVSMIHKAMTELRRVYIDYTPAPITHDPVLDIHNGKHGSVKKLIPPSVSLIVGNQPAVP